MSKLIDLTGQRFGKLTVVERYIDGSRYTKWRCMCDCGNETIKLSTTLKRPGNHSCGCLCGTEHLNFKGNRWEFDGNIAIGYDARDNCFYIDKSDVDIVNKYRWSGMDKSTRRSIGDIYFCARMSRKSEGGNKMKMLQNFIWEHHYGTIPDRYRIDHINTKPYDNRLSNLRLANKSENAFNAERVNKSSNVNIVGITKTKDDAKSNPNRYRAYISYGGKRHELGYFKNLQDAIIVRLKAELENFGEICPSNREFYEQYKDVING